MPDNTPFERKSTPEGEFELRNGVWFKVVQLPDGESIHRKQRLINRTKQRKRFRSRKQR